MITDVVTTRGSAAITSDQWHVVHSRFTDARRRLPFSRLVSSEHADRAACVVAARGLIARLRAEAGKNVPAAQRDEVFVRRPGYKSLKTARRRNAGRLPE